MNENTVSEFDIVIIGGGMVGLCFANAVAHLPIKIAIIENKKPSLKWPKKGFDTRVSALTQSSQQILNSLGAWEKMLDLRVSPYNNMHVWDATGNGVIHFDAAEIGELYLGHIVENRVTHKALYQLAQVRNNIEFVIAQPKAIVTNKQKISIHLDNEQNYQTSLLVGADGAQSFVRKNMGVDLVVHDYKQTAIVTTVLTERHHAHTAWQRFSPTGPLAFLPLSDGYSSIVWSTNTEEAESILSMDDQEFSLALQNAFGTKLGKITEVSPRTGFPLRSQHAQSYIKPNIALIGDAAHTIHPLAGQGVNLGFSDAACLAEIIADAHEQQRPMGALSSLRRYERWRRGDNLMMQTLMTGFKYLFGNQLAVVSPLRNLGLNITNKLSPLKHQIIRSAMGLNGDQPKIAIRR